MKLKLTGVPPYDGEYPFDLDHFTNRELKIIKKTSGYTGPEWPTAFSRGDNDFLVALAFVMLRRAGHVNIREDALWDAPADSSIDIIVDEVAVVDAGPPPQPTPSPPSETNDSSTPSGEPLNGASDYHPERSPASIGHRP